MERERKKKLASVCRLICGHAVNYTDPVKSNKCAFKLFSLLVINQFNISSIDSWFALMKLCEKILYPTIRMFKFTHVFCIAWCNITSLMFFVFHSLIVNSRHHAMVPWPSTRRSGPLDIVVRLRLSQKMIHRNQFIWLLSWATKLVCPTLCVRPTVLVPVSIKYKSYIVHSYDVILVSGLL